MNVSSRAPCPNGETPPTARPGRGAHGVGVDPPGPGRPCGRGEAPLVELVVAGDEGEHDPTGRPISRVAGGEDQRLDDLRDLDADRRGGIGRRTSALREVTDLDVDPHRSGMVGDGSGTARKVPARGAVGRNAGHSPMLAQLSWQTGSSVQHVEFEQRSCGRRRAGGSRKRGRGGG